MTTEPAQKTEQEQVERATGACAEIRKALANVVVGQHEVIDQMLLALFSGGHCLISGAPGLAKTLLVKSLAQVFHLKFQRIQFTPDLMPADITGTEILMEDAQGGRKLSFVPGPIFANIILADEINRTPPKTQSALLEAMQEHQVTASGHAHRLEEPFFVLATKNPIEMEGTYGLPEAQLDRFMFDIQIDYLSETEEVEVIKQTTSRTASPLKAILTGEDLLAFQQLIRKVPVADEVVQFAVRLTAASRPNRPGAPAFVNDWVNWGAGTRAGQYLVLGAKARALIDGRSHANYDDVRWVSHPVLRHRILLNYKAEAEGKSVGDVIDRLIETVQPK